MVAELGRTGAGKSEGEGWNGMAMYVLESVVS